VRFIVRTIVHYWQIAEECDFPGEKLEENMRTLLTVLATATILMASTAIIWKAEAAIVTGVGNPPLSNSYSLVEKVRCVCGPYGCACGRRHWRPYGSPGYPGYRPYRYYGSYRWRY
jgi:hypothetical protein